MDKLTDEQKKLQKEEIEYALNLRLFYLKQTIKQNSSDWPSRDEEKIKLLLLALENMEKRS